jgi:hypothetical protein
LASTGKFVFNGGSDIADGVISEKRDVRGGLLGPERTRIFIQSYLLKKDENTKTYHWSKYQEFFLR